MIVKTESLYFKTETRTIFISVIITELKRKDLKLLPYKLFIDFLLSNLSVCFELIIQSIVTVLF